MVEKEELARGFVSYLDMTEWAKDWDFAAVHSFKYFTENDVKADFQLDPTSYSFPGSLKVSLKAAGKWFSLYMRSLGALKKSISLLASSVLRKPRKALIPHNDISLKGRYDKFYYYFKPKDHTVIHQLMLHQKLKVQLKHHGQTFSLKNCTFSLGDLQSLFPPNFRAIGFVAVEEFQKYRCNIKWWEVFC